MLLKRIINKVSSILFSEYCHKYCKSVGISLKAGFNWSIIHPECITIGNNFISNTNLRLQCWTEYNGESTCYARGNRELPCLIIGSNVTMISNCQISCVNKVFIDDGCLLGDNVLITDNFHGTASSDELNIPPALRKLSSKGSVIIGKNCWLGRNACVMPGVTIGDGCIIGANAVVTRNIPSYSVAVGVPAKVIKVLR